MITDPLLNPQYEETLARLTRMVRRANGFVLGFVKCNSLVQQRSQSEELRTRLGDMPTLEITLEAPILSLLELLETRIDPDAPPALVNVYGLEKSVYADQDYSPMLGRLNNDRDLIRRTCPTALLIWLPDYALDSLVLSAPDFWAWRSGVYEFPTDHNDWKDASSTRLETQRYQLASMTLSEKRQEVASLEELIRTARSLPNAGNEEKQIIAGLLLQVGRLYHDLEELMRVQDCIKESIHLYRECNNMGGASISTTELARVLSDQGQIEEALKLLWEQVAAYEQLGATRNRAITLGEIARILWFQGRIEEALKLQREQLAVYEQLGDPHSIAVTLGEIARILRSQGQTDEALKLHREQLAVYEQLGDTYSRVATLGNIARILRLQGQTDEALKLFREQIAIYEQLGETRGRAVMLGDIADILLLRGQIDEALNLQRERLAIDERLRDMDGIANTLWRIATILLERQEFTEAAEMLERSYTILLDLGRLEGICWVGIDWGHILLMDDRREEGVAVLARSRDGFVQLGQMDNARRVEEMIAQISRQGNGELVDVAGVVD